MENNHKKIFTGLFNKAKDNASIQYVFTLLRVWGLQRFEKDPILDLYEFLRVNKKSINNAEQDDLEGYLKRIFSAYSVYLVMWNLINNCNGVRYQTNPFEITLPESERIDFDNNFYLTKLHKKIKEHDNDLYELFIKSFSGDVFSKRLVQMPSIDFAKYKKNIKSISNLFIDFIEIYFAQLKSFKQDRRSRKLHKLPSSNFEVIELLVDDKRGLYGFVIYNSNGSESVFRRLEKRVEAINLLLSDSVGLMVGNIAALKPVWMVKDKPLYEIGLPGRYNIVGEWKPLEYPGDSSLIEKRVRELTKDKTDTRIMGCLFYIMTTCHHVIEFIVKSDFNLPFPRQTIGTPHGDLHMDKINIKGEDNNYLANLRVYDCVVELPDITPDSIERALQLIDVALNRLVFRIDGKFEWTLKYPYVDRPLVIKRIKKKDTDILGNYITGFKGEDSCFFDAAISWYISGNRAENIFTKYLSYYIALEGLAIRFITGNMEISKEYGIKKLPKKERRERVEKCISTEHDELYISDPIKFINKSYVHCILSNKFRTEAALKKIFGDHHAYIKQFFGKINGNSLYDLRNNLAHGTFTLVDFEHKETIEKRLDNLRNITYDFIIRLSTGTKHNSEYKRFSPGFSLSIVMADPRSIGVVSNLNLMSNKDWRIKLEWLF